MPLYRDVMTSADRTSRRISTAVSALWSAPAWRATGNALAAAGVGAVGGILLGGLVLIWGAAIVSLVHWPVGGWAHAAEYIAAAVAGPVLMLWAVQGLTALQRSRLRATLGLDIPAGPRASERKPWPVGPWLAAATWRQLGFHLLAIVTGVIGGGLVAACWLAPVAAIAYLAVGHPPASAGAAAVAGRPGCCSRRPGWPGRSRGRTPHRPGRCSGRPAARNWRSGSSRWPAAGPTPSPRPTPSAAGSSGICTTARSSGWSPWP